jgi:hypothetical protein
MLAMPTRPAANTRIITTTPMSWISAAGMNSKMASVALSCGPWLAYMNRAKKTDRASAMTVTRNVCRYMVRARCVRS